MSDISDEEYQAKIDALWDAGLGSEHYLRATRTRKVTLELYEVDWRCLCEAIGNSSVDIKYDVEDVESFSEIFNGVIENAVDRKFGEGNYMRMQFEIYKQLIREASLENQNSGPEGPNP